MNNEFSSLQSEELVALFYKINKELTSEFRNHASWKDQQERINKLSKISEELSKRKIKQVEVSHQE